VCGPVDSGVLRLGSIATAVLDSRSKHRHTPEYQNSEATVYYKFRPFPIPARHVHQGVVAVTESAIRHAGDPGVDDATRGWGFRAAERASDTCSISARSTNHPQHPSKLTV